MSVISDRHSFQPFTAGKSKPFDNQRLAKVSYKQKSGKQSQCVSIPILADTDVLAINEAFPVDLRKRAEDFQDSLIRALYEGGKTTIASEEISRAQILAYLENAETSGRLSGDVVREWWNKEFLETALPILSEKYGSEDEELLAKKANVWREAFASLVGKSPVTADRISQLREMLEFADDDDMVAQRLILKCDALAKELAELEAL